MYKKRSFIYIKRIKEILGYRKSYIGRGRILYYEIKSR